MMLVMLVVMMVLILVMLGRYATMVLVMLVVMMVLILVMLGRDATQVSGIFIWELPKVSACRDCAARRPDCGNASNLAQAVSQIDYQPTPFCTLDTKTERNGEGGSNSLNFHFPF